MHPDDHATDRVHPTTEYASRASSLVGRPAPVFSARSTQGQLSLDDYRGQWTILCFHPAAFTPVCTTEFVEMARRQGEFSHLGVRMIAISVDSVYSHMAWINWIKEQFGVEVSFPVVEDVAMRIAIAYGLIDANSESTEGVRACCFLDPSGIVRALIHYPMQIGRSIDETLRLQTALQAAEKTGNTCPVDWREGDALMAYPEEGPGADDTNWLKQAVSAFKEK